MTESIPLSLQAFPKENNDKQSISYLIQRINDQKGSFRSITEESLEAEIQAGGPNGIDREDAIVEPTEEGEDGKQKEEDLSKAREEILKQIL